MTGRCMTPTLFWLQDSRLEQPCKCPRMVHRACLARWQVRGQCASAVHQTASCYASSRAKTSILGLPSVCKGSHGAMCALLVRTCSSNRLAGGGCRNGSHLTALAAAQRTFKLPAHQPHRKFCVCYYCVTAARSGCAASVRLSSQTGVRA